MSYDRIEWHSEGNFSKELPHENGGTHIGIFLAWAIIHNLEGDLHHDSEREEKALQAVRNRTITGRDFLCRQCDEKFTDEDLNEEGNRFALWYYESNGEGRPNYFADYCQVLTDNSHDSAYHLDDCWNNYDRIAPVIDRRFDEWKRGIKSQPLHKLQKAKPWW
jgi:hypothetical protein